jgi:hypothetical protein
MLLPALLPQPQVQRPLLPALLPRPQPTLQLRLVRRQPPRRLVQRAALRSNQVGHCKKAASGRLFSCPDVFLRLGGPWDAEGLAKSLRCAYTVTK